MDESNADEIFALVVDAYQNPIRYKDWWSTRVDLPLGCGVLLRIANGDLEQADHYCHTANVSKGDLQEAAVFFVKQAFFVKAETITGPWDLTCNQRKNKSRTIIAC